MMATSAWAKRHLGFRAYRWVVWFWWAKVRRKPETVCRPDCPLCEVQCRINAHYETCVECQGPGYPCAAMKPLRDEEDAATVALFPELGGTISPYANGTASSVPVVEIKPWVWGKP